MESIFNYTTSLIPVAPVMPAAGWVGGKRILAKKLIARINTTPHSCYVEPFLGMGGVFLRRNYRPKCEVINDYDRELINFFRIIQRHPESLETALRWRLSSRSDFDLLRHADLAQFTDIERAARFYYLQRLSFGGKPGGVFGLQKTGSASFNLSTALQRFTNLHRRLETVIIESLPWQKIIERYDDHKTLFYLDPPYYGSEDYYNAPFSRGEFIELADKLRNIKGKFILSINDCPEIRKIFSGLQWEEVILSYSLSKLTSGREKRRCELIIYN